MEMLLGCYKVIEELPAEIPSIRNCLAEQQPLGRKVFVSIFTSIDKQQLNYAYKMSTQFSCLNHPNLESILDIGKDGLQLIVVREYWDGEPFKEWLANNQPLKKWQVEQLFNQMVTGVCKLGENSMLYGTLTMDRFFMAKTTDERQLLKVISSADYSQQLEVSSAAVQLAKIGLELAGISAEQIPETVDELDKACPQLAHQWLKLLHGWLHGVEMPQKFSDICTAVLVCSTTLNKRRDTWTMGNSTVSVTAPGKKLVPSLVGAALGFLLMGGGYVAYHHFAAPQEYVGPVNSVSWAMTGPFSGANRELGLSMCHGLEVAFAEYNSVKRPFTLELTALDDGYEAKKAKDNGTLLLADKEIVGLVGAVGTAAAADLRSLAVADKRLLLGAMSGAEFLQREADESFVYNYRPRYGREMGALLEYLVKERQVNPHRIAIFYQNGPFGLGGLNGFYKSIKNLGVANPKEELVHAFYRANSLDVTAAAEQLLSKKEQIDLVVMVSTYNASYALIKTLAAAGFYPQYGALSVMGTEALGEQIKEYSPEKLELIVTQVVPDYRGNSDLAEAYRAAVEKYGPEHEADSISFEGYINGRLIGAALDGLAKSQPMTGEAMAGALDKGVSIDFGESNCQFAKNRHFCLEEIWLSSMDEKGGLRWLGRRPL